MRLSFSGTPHLWHSQSHTLLTLLPYFVCSTLITPSRSIYFVQKSRRKNKSYFEKMIYFAKKINHKNMSNAGIYLTSMPSETKSAWSPKQKWEKRLSIRFIPSICQPSGGCTNCFCSKPTAQTPSILIAPNFRNYFIYLKIRMWTR